MQNTPLEHKIIRIIEPVIKDMGFNLVMLEFKGGVLQILAEDPRTGNLSLDDCTSINKAISPLEVEDPITGAYTLEISSPGIDRPLIHAKDFKKYVGYEAKVELDEAVNANQRRFRGRIVKEENEFVTLLVDKVEHRLEIAAIKRARLVLTDELIKATRMEREILQETTN